MKTSSILLKLKEYDNKLANIETNKNDISSNLERIAINENNIITNSDNIDTNKNNIKTNSDNIDTNKNNITSNLKDISRLQNDYNKIIQGDDYFILKNIHLLELDFVKNIMLELNDESVIYETEIDSVFKENDYLQLNETIYYQFENVKLSLHLIKEHYIFKNENNEIIYDFEYNVSSRGSIVNNSYIFKDKNLLKLIKICLN